MKLTKSILVELILPFLFCWFFMTVLVDIVTIPTVFKNISNIQEAGKIGMSVFGKFNCFEIFFGVMVLAGTLSMKEKSKVFIGISIMLLLTAIFYTFFMTPLIANNSVQLHSVLNTDPQYEVFHKQNILYHKLYRFFDTTKLCVLIGLGIMVARFNLLRMHKECV